ncbi:DMT family transporter [Kosmotoga pacifica]|uniref:Membrane protein n=1 Tax=Kosmotoga pacifica TaxID=1330330 RepID=A0A0G2ZBF0_9BACT|nr:DMT family transporter [Kosmotoga pacifica]AKI96899.1 membrane protein [Kosmotoga pacifica]
MTVPILALALRILLLAFEKIVLKFMGDRTGALYRNLAASFLFFFIGALVLLPFAVTREISNWHFLIPCLLSALLYSFSSFAYVSSIATGEVSLVTPISSLNAAVILLFAAAFLGEKITGVKLLGIFLMLYGIFILKGMLTPLKSFRAIINDRPSQLMFVSVVLQSLGRVIDKSFASDNDPLIYATMLYFVVSFNFFLLLQLRKKGKQIVSSFREKPFPMLIGGAINGAAYLFLLIAIKSIELSLVEPLANLSIILAMFFAAVIFKEKLLEKLPGGLLVILGGWLLAMSV